MHRDLERWLDEVWRDRAAIFQGIRQTGRAITAFPIETHHGIFRVYDYYTSGTGDSSGSASGDASQTPAFLTTLAEFLDTRQASCCVQWRNEFFEVSSADLLHVAAGRFLLISDPDFDDQGMPPDEAPTEPIIHRFDSGMLGRAFIHVWNPKLNSDTAIHRIYLNFGTADRAKHFVNVLGGVYDHPHFSSSKVVGSAASPRNDTGLLYLKDQDAVDAALVHIRHHQSENLDAYYPGLPTLTKPVDGLRGVGLGMEPPGYAVIRRSGQYFKKTSGMSFGFYRAALIFMALDRTYWERQGQSDDQRRAAFKRRAAKYFRAAGIDPDNPSVQTNPDHLQELGR